jgi:hypothetical protein
MNERCRASIVSRHVGLLSPNATSVGFSVNPEENEIPEEISTPATGLLDEPGERSSILPDDMVR